MWETGTINRGSATWSHAAAHDIDDWQRGTANIFIRSLPLWRSYFANLTHSVVFFTLHCCRREGWTTDKANTKANRQTASEISSRVLSDGSNSTWRRWGFASSWAVIVQLLGRVLLQTWYCLWCQRKPHGDPMTYIHRKHSCFTPFPWRMSCLKKPCRSKRCHSFTFGSQL